MQAFRTAPKPARTADGTTSEASLVKMRDGTAASRQLLMRPNRPLGSTMPGGGKEGAGVQFVGQQQL